MFQFTNQHILRLENTKKSLQIDCKGLLGLLQKKACPHGASDKIRGKGEGALGSLGALRVMGALGDVGALGVLGALGDLGEL